jgi:hypothetical protein
VTGAEHDVDGARNTVGVTYAASTMLSTETGRRFYRNQAVVCAARGTVNAASYPSISPPRTGTLSLIRRAP